MVGIGRPLVPAGAVSNRITGVERIVDCATAHRRPTGSEGLADDSNCGRCHCRDLGSRGDWRCVLIPSGPTQSYKDGYYAQTNIHSETLSDGAPTNLLSLRKNRNRSW